MSTPSPEDIKTSTEKAVSFVEWLVEVLRGKNWVRKLLVLDVFLFAVFNPVFFPQALKLLTDQPLPKEYPLFFWLVIGLIFIATLIVALRTMPRKTGVYAPDFVKRSPIKGLRPFGFEDAELFAHLQREQDLNECLEAIADREFSFGILSGESGCGKSSFLQAGLWPRLERQKVPHRCVYVKFTDLDPLVSIRQALADQIQLPKERIEGADFRRLLAALVQLESKTIVLLFDQFEQFFVHRKLKRDREPFVNALAAWYQQQPRLPVKILVCVRSDFSDHLIELQKAMGYSLGPQQSFRLEKFEPKSASEIFHVIAEAENIAFDQHFAEEIAERELASREDGLVSPVDLQILAWMIGGQKTAEQRAFNRPAYQKLGGIEGLLERFLARTLAARETEGRRQAALKLLLALTDLERNVSAGVLTLDDLQKKVTRTIAAREVNETVAWLARGDVRLITSSKRDATLGYELAHEHLIPAVRRLAGKELSLADQANQLLDRRVNEWLGNNCTGRYLLSWRELLFIKKQKPYLVWGDKKSQKERLLKQSRRRLQRHTGIAFVSLILLIVFWVWWQSPWGQIYQIKNELLSLGRKVKDSEALIEVTQAFASIGNFEQARQVALTIPDDSRKAYALGSIAESLARMGEAEKAIKVIEQARQMAVTIPDDSRKASALGSIAESLAKMGEAIKDLSVIEQARQIAVTVLHDRDKASALRSIAESLAKMGNWQEARKIAESNVTDSARAKALAAILKVWATRKNPPLPEAEM